jgi:hypothetical protein
MIDDLAGSSRETLTSSERWANLRRIKAQAEGKHLVEQISDMVYGDGQFDLNFERRLVAAKRGLSLYNGESKDFRAEFVARGKAHNGHQTWLIRNVRLFGDDYAILADHVWILPSRAIIREFSPFQGDDLAIHARVRPYEHPPITVSYGERTVTVTECSCLDPVYKVSLLKRSNS